MAPEEDAIHVPIGVVGQQVYLYTNYRAPKGRIVAARLVESDRSKWQTIVPEGNDAIADARAVLIGDRIAVVYLADVQSRVRLYGLDGEWRGEVSLPEPGSIAEIEGRNDGSEFYFRFSSYLRPATVYRYDLRSASLEAVLSAQVTVRSFAVRDSPSVILRIEGRHACAPVHHSGAKGVALDGGNPTILHGYGGFDIPATPELLAGNRRLARAGRRIRGRELAGRRRVRRGVAQGRHARECKQNVFDDFIAAAEYLIEAALREARVRLAISGGSNGGLLVGAQR